MAHAVRQVRDSRHALAQIYPTLLHAPAPERHESCSSEPIIASVSTAPQPRADFAGVIGLGRLRDNCSVRDLLSRVTCADSCVTMTRFSPVLAHQRPERTRSN